MSSFVLTVKIPDSLRNRLEKESEKVHLSKGALVRAALENFFNRNSTSTDRIKKITEAHKKGKKLNHKIDWKVLAQKAQQSHSTITPEEEIILSRMRGF